MQSLTFVQTLDRPKTCKLPPLNTHQLYIHIVHISSMYEATIQHLSTVDKNLTKSTICSLYSTTPVTLKQSQGHQTYHENVDPEQGYSHAIFERSHFNSV